MAMQAPLILATEASVMLRPPRHLVRPGVPDAVLREAHGPGSQNRQDAKDSLRKVRNLLESSSAWSHLRCESACGSASGSGTTP